VWEITKGMNDPAPTNCPQCDHDDVDRDYSGDRIITIMELNQPKSIGELADKNTEKMVKYGALPKEHLDYDSNKQKKKDLVNKAERFSKKTEQQKMDYIISGKE
jgi:hypothetical protein